MKEKRVKQGGREKKGVRAPNEVLTACSSTSWRTITGEGESGNRQEERGKFAGEKRLFGEK